MWFFKFCHKQSDVEFYIEAISLREAWQRVWKMFDFDADKYAIEHTGRYKTLILIKEKPKWII